MVDIRINQLPSDASPVATDVLPIDGLTTRQTTIQAAVEIGRPAASQAEAEAGVNSTKTMTALTTSQAVNFYALTKAGNLSGLTNVPMARSNLGLGSAAVESASSFATAVQGGYADLFNAILPTAQVNVQGTGMPGFDGGSLFFYNAPPTPSDVPTLRVDRNASFTGGLAGTNKNGWFFTTVGAANTGFEWGLVSELHDYSTGSQDNVALNATGWRHTSGGSRLWGGNFVAHDLSTQVNPTTSLIGTEINVFAVSGGTDTNRKRIGLQLGLGGFTGTHVGYGILMGGVPGTVVNRGIMFQGTVEAAGTWGIGIDMTDAVFSTAAIMLADGQRIAFDGAYNGTFNRSLRTASGQLIYRAVGADVFTVGDTGIVQLKQTNFVNPTLSSSATASGASPLPATPDGYLTIGVNGAAKKVAFYN